MTASIVVHVALPCCVPDCVLLSSQLMEGRGGGRKGRFQGKALQINKRGEAADFLSKAVGQAPRPAASAPAPAAADNSKENKRSSSSSKAPAAAAATTANAVASASAGSANNAPPAAAVKPVALPSAHAKRVWEPVRADRLPLSFYA